MTHALDANAVSVAFRDGESGPARGILAHPRGSIAIPNVVRGEILFGALKGGSPRIVKEVRVFLGLFPPRPSTSVASRSTPKPAPMLSARANASARSTC